MTQLSVVERIERIVVRGLGRVPRGALERLTARRGANAAGERVAPEIAVALAALNRIPSSDFSKAPVEGARRQIDAEALVFAEDFAPAERRVAARSGTERERRAIAFDAAR